MDLRVYQSKWLSIEPGPLYRQNILLTKLLDSPRFVNSERRRAIDGRCKTSAFARSILAERSRQTRRAKQRLQWVPRCFAQDKRIRQSPVLRISRRLLSEILRTSLYLLSTRDCLVGPFPRFIVHFLRETCATVSATTNLSARVLDLVRSPHLLIPPMISSLDQSNFHLGAAYCVTTFSRPEVCDGDSADRYVINSCLATPVHV